MFRLFILNAILETAKKSFFWDLLSLEFQRAETITSEMFQFLWAIKGIFEKVLVHFASGTASVMVGKKSGVA